MKKLFTLLTMLIVAISASWAEDFTITPLNGSYLSPGNIAKVSLTGDMKASSTQIQTTSSSKSGTVTFSTSAPDMYIKSVTFTDANNGTNKQATVTQTSADGSTASTSGVYTFTGGNGITSVTYSVVATSSGAAKLGSVSIVVSNGSSNSLVTMSTFSKSGDAITASSITCNGETVTTAPITMSSTQWTASSNNISAPSSNDTKTITITSENKIKYLAFVDTNCRLSLVETSSTGGTVDGASWTAPTSGSVKSVTFKNGISTSLTISKIYVITESAPTHKVEYVLGDATGGTAPTQADVAEGAKFTVANAPSNLVPPTDKEFKCWNDGTNDYNEGAEYTMGTSDVEFTAVYQNVTVKYAVSYAAGEGTGSMDVTEKAEGAVFNLPASTFTEPEGKVFANWLCSVDGETYAAGDPYTMTAEATTFTAQYVAVAPKIIYSLVDGIGSATVTTATATVSEGSLSLGNTNGRIKLTAATGEKFQNGDAISFSGTIGNTSKKYGIKYGTSTSLGTTLEVAAGAACSVSGTLSSMGANGSSDLYIGRADGSTTTMTDFVVSRSVGVSSESFANVIINGVSATEGTDYTVSGNTITLSKTYLVCPVVRIVGNATFADASTGKTNHPVTLALDEDVYTGTTSIAGTSYTVNVPYKGGESIDLSNTAGYNYGFGGYCAPENFTLTGGTAYAAKIVNDKIVLTSYDTEYIPKNTGVIIAGDKGATVTITYTATTTPNLVFPDNDLKGTNARTLTATLKGSAAKFLTLQKSTSKFIQYTGEYFPANRAYLLIESASAPESLEMVFADEATAIKEVNADENANSATPVKVIKNGKLYIGNFNVAGQQVK